MSLSDMCDVRSDMCDVRSDMCDVRSDMCDVRSDMCVISRSDSYLQFSFYVFYAMYLPVKRLMWRLTSEAW